MYGLCGQAVVLRSDNIIYEERIQIITIFHLGYGDMLGEDLVYLMNVIHQSYTTKFSLIIRAHLVTVYKKCYFTA